MIDFILENNETGESLKKSITLTEEQNQKLLKLASEDEVQCFLAKIAESQNIFADLREELSQQFGGAPKS